MHFLNIVVLSALLFWACKQDPVGPAVNGPATQDSVKYLALGNSYTIGQSVPVSERYPVQLSDSLETEGEKFSEVNIIAQTGWTTGDLLSALGNQKVANDYDLVSLLIGVNNQYQGRSIEEYEREFRRLLDSAITKAGGDKENVFVISIPDYGYTPFGRDNQASISEEIDAFNAVNQFITDSTGVRYFNITPISRRGLEEPSLIASDSLHPSGKQYAEWVRLMYDGVYQKLIP